ncbi:helix-turn-helix domain-containing protein [Defluviimonas salinarum]|uniref:Helix-turn-helix domain-containing protein n=1 Tax=Defluviimonas salinarum TaxID=2992147 RepID=A0ABT3J5F7_9RHOB|nr:helix-turn-helix transcriptional regulator [Defluviimonas salinarum]MCW3782932.1 helix-turn-helix domain-containing protein [Defluviimonas salinarum]
MDLFDISDRIREARKARGLTQEELAERAGLSRVRLNQLENGAVFDMKFGSVMSVLEALDLTLRIGTANAGRPTLDDLQREQEEDSAPGL